MNLDNPNLHLVVRVAEALGSLRDELTFVGGCATGLLITDVARPPVRATTDVDLVAEVTSRADYYGLVSRLKRAGFREDLEGTICRWRLGDLLVDVMPTDEEILGFSNRWYVEAVNSARDYQLTNLITIKLVTPPLLVATKIEAYYGRGKDDPGTSHDIEDIVTLIDGRPELLEEIQKVDDSLREYLREEVDELLANSTFVDTLPWHFTPEDQGRVPMVVERLRRIAGL